MKRSLKIAAGIAASLSLALAAAASAHPGWQGGAPCATNGGGSGTGPGAGYGPGDGMGPRSGYGPGAGMGPGWMARPPRDIVIRLESIDQLFNAPDINPFSAEEVDVLGEPALLRAVRRLLSQRIRNWEGMRLVLELPTDQITPGLEQLTEQAIRRYSDAKIEDNHLTIRLGRTRSLIGLGMVTIISIVVMGLAYLIFNTVLADSPDSVKTLLVASISVFVWVILWDPMEKLLFDWVQPHMENRILRKLPTLDIVIRSKS